MYLFPFISVILFLSPSFIYWNYKRIEYEEIRKQLEVDTRGIKKRISRNDKVMVSDINDIFCKFYSKYRGTDKRIIKEIENDRKILYSLLKK